MSAPTLQGEGRYSAGPRKGFRATTAATISPPFPGYEEALRDVELREHEVIEVPDPGQGKGSRFRAAPGTHTIEIQPVAPAGTTDYAQAILYEDPGGGLSWHIVQPPRAKRGFRASGVAVVRVELRTPPAGLPGGPARYRGLGAQALKHTLRILVIPLLRRAAGPAIKSIVAALEKRVQREGARLVTADNYTARDVALFTKWRDFAGPRKRTLLILHGTFSSTPGMLARVPKSQVRLWHKFYEGRVVALDHFTLCKTPEQNARDLLEALAKAAPGESFEFDILAHSRGGLIARALAEQATAPSGVEVAVRSAYFVGTPNRGTALADGQHLADLIDAYTNFLALLPDGPIVVCAQLVVGLVKLLAHGETHVPGLQAMNPNGGWVETLNRKAIQPQARYAGASADYESVPGGERRLLTTPVMDAIIDRVFGKDANDLVVPTDGVGGDNHHPAFPLREVLRFNAQDGVWHSSMLGDERMHSHFISHLHRVGIGVYAGPPSPKRKAAGSPQLKAGTSRIPLPSGLPRRGGLGAARAPPLGSRRSAPFAGVPPSAKRSKATKYRSAARLEDRAAYGELPASAPPPTFRKMAAMRDLPSRARNPASAESKPAFQARRDPSIKYHEMIREGVSGPLAVRLSEARSPRGGRVVVDIPVGKESVKVDVRLDAPGFRVKGKAARTITVGRVHDADRETATFVVTPLSPGPQPNRRRLTAAFWLGNRCIGSVTHWTRVVPKEWAAPVHWEPGDGDSRSEPLVFGDGYQNPDWIVRVTSRDVDAQPPYRIHVRSEISGMRYEKENLGDFTLQAVSQTDLAAYLNSVYDDLFQRMPATDSRTDRKAWEKGFVDALDQLGRRLWGFLPQAFRDEYFRLHDAGKMPRSIMVVSNELVLPWELLVPNRKTGSKLQSLPAWGQAHALGRWVPNATFKPDPQRMVVQQFCVLNPTYQGNDFLEWGEKEAESLAQMFPRARRLKPADLKNVKSSVLKAKDIHFLHFTGHGKFNPQNADLSTLLLEGGQTMRALDLYDTPLSLSGHPFIYLNACEVGSVGTPAGHSSGFVNACLSSGFSGAVAPYWRVDDEQATKFSLSLYDKLRAGHSWGEAMRDLRKAGRSDPTVQAYAFFGDPMARCVFP